MVRFLKASYRHLGTSILSCPDCLHFFYSDPEFLQCDWTGSTWHLLSHCALPVSQALCRQRRWRLFIPAYCLASWSPLIIDKNHLAGLCSEPDCSSSALCSFFAVLSETAKEITVEIAGDLFCPSMLWRPASWVCTTDWNDSLEILQTAIIHLLIPAIPVPVPVLLGGRLHPNECSICKTGCQCHGICSLYSNIEQVPSHR